MSNADSGRGASEEGEKRHNMAAANSTTAKMAATNKMADNAAATTSANGECRWDEYLMAR